MAKKYTVGLNFFFDNHTNSGVVNYIYNIISALKTLEEEKKPSIIVFYSENAPIDYLKQIEYPYIEFIHFIPYPKIIILRKVNSLLKKLLGRDLYKERKYLNKIDCLYPYLEFTDHHFSTAKNKIHWLVDFNNRAFPDHYADKGEVMKNYQEKITHTKDRVVLSSNSLLDELKMYYPDYTCDIKILSFASSLQVKPPKEDLFKKYDIQEGLYFMSPNQFWEHKNQSVVLEALSILKKERPDKNYQVVFTGSLEVNRGKGLYIQKLQELVSSHNLTENIRFLGVLERNEQLFLMSKSMALIQPSLYEGWSTLVEEAKALNKWIILSDIPVHREQIQHYCDFFNPKISEELAERMMNIENKSRANIPIPYNYNIEKYGRDLINAFSF